MDKITLGQKIRQVRKEKKLTLYALEKRLKEMLGKEALRYNSLSRIEKGVRKARPSSLSQICLGLGISLEELKKGTVEEKFSSLGSFKKNDNVPQYVYSQKAFAQILTFKNQPFQTLRLVLAPRGEARPKQDPLTLGKFTEWLYGLRGKITCVVGPDRYILNKDEVLYFENNLPYFFENNTRRKASCIIIQCPKQVLTQYLL